jgi:hypothetical protein
VWFDDSKLPSALVIHDSFGEPLRQMLSESFARTTWSWGWKFDEALIEREHPDVVIELWVDRKLVEAPPPLRGDRALVARGQFNASNAVLLAMHGAELSAGVTTQGQARLVPFAAGVTLEGGGARAAMLPRVIDVPDDSRVVLRIELEVPARAQLVIFYSTRTAQGFDRARTELVDVEAGANDVCVEMSAADFDGRVRLQLLPPAPQWSLRGFEARAVEQP